MTSEMLDVRTLLEKSLYADLVCELIDFAAQRVMELEVGTSTAAGHGERHPKQQLALRDVYRDQDWETWAGTMEPENLTRNGKEFER